MYMYSENEEEHLPLWMVPLSALQLHGFPLAYWDLKQAWGPDVPPEKKRFSFDNNANVFIFRGFEAAFEAMPQVFLQATILHYRFVYEVDASVGGLRLQLISVAASLLAVGISQYSMAYANLEEDVGSGFAGGKTSEF